MTLKFVTNLVISLEFYRAIASTLDAIEKKTNRCTLF